MKTLKKVLRVVSLGLLIIMACMGAVAPLPTYRKEKEQDGETQIEQVEQQNVTEYQQEVVDISDEFN